MIKPNLKKIVSIITVVSLVATMVILEAHSESTEPALADQTAETDTKVEQKISDDPAMTVGKEETVYVLSDAEGNVNKVIVSNWLKNNDKLNNLKDVSDLNDIENVKGDETYSLDKNNMKIWHANGNDIYYQGTTDKKLPVDVAVSYKLNGKAISADELAGKSGKVKIHFQYTNNQSKDAVINGKTEKLYVPFAMMTGMMLDNDKFSNIDVSNGKVISDGTRSIIVGIALPGVQESLGLDKDDIDIPDYVDITADVKDFELTTTLTIAINDIFNEVDWDDVQDWDDLEDKMNDFKEGADDLLDGTSDMYDGCVELMDKCGELVDGVNDLYDGANDLNDGASDLLDGAQDLNDGASDLNDGAIELNDGLTSLRDGALELNDGLNTLKDGTDDLYDGAEELDEGAEDLRDGASDLVDGAHDLNGGLAKLTQNNSTLVGGAEKVFNALLSTAEKQINDVIKSKNMEPVSLTIDNYDAEIDKIIGTFTGSAQQKVTEKVTYEYKKNIINKVMSAVTGTTGSAISVEQFEQGVSAGVIPIEAKEAVDKTLSSPEIQAQIKATISNYLANDPTIQAGMAQLKPLTDGKAQLDEYNSFYQGLITYTNGVSTATDGSHSLFAGTMKLYNGTRDLKDGTEELMDGATDLRDGSKDLLDGSDDLLAGAKDLTDGSHTLRNGTSDLVDGTKTLLDGCFDLKDGTTDLVDGVEDLKDGVKKLVDGVQELVDGAFDLNDGMQEFYDEGVQEILDKYGDVDDLVDRMKELTNISKAYKNFSGIADDADGNVKFIYKTDSIELGD